MSMTLRFWQGESKWNRAVVLKWWQTGLIQFHIAAWIHYVQKTLDYLNFGQKMRTKMFLSEILDVAPV